MKRTSGEFDVVAGSQLDCGGTTQEKARGDRRLVVVVEERKSVLSRLEEVGNHLVAAMAGGQGSGLYVFVTQG